MKPRVTKVETSWRKGILQTLVKIEVPEHAPHGWQVAKGFLESDPRAAVNYPGGWFYAGGENATVEAMRFASDIAARLDRGEEIREGEEPVDPATGEPTEEVKS